MMKNKSPITYLCILSFIGFIYCIANDSLHCFLFMSSPLSFENMNDGMQPFQWMGKKSFPLKNSYGFDIDEEWQKAAIEVWLKQNWVYEK